MSLIILFKKILYKSLKEISEIFIIYIIHGIIFKLYYQKYI